MTARGEVRLEQPSGDTLKVVLSGPWKLGGELPGIDQVRQRLQDQPVIRKVVFDTRQLASWDTGLFKMNRSGIREPVTGPDYGDLVAA